MQESYDEYLLIAAPEITLQKKWRVGVIVKRYLDGEMRSRYFLAHDKIEYLLEVEAAKEGINLGKNLIKKKLVGF